VLKLFFETLFFILFFSEMDISNSPAPGGDEMLVLTKFPHKGGRQAKYHTADDKAAAQRHNAILHYHRKRALQKRIKEILENEGPDGIQNGDTIDVHINIFSKGLGDYSEDIYYRVIDKDRGAYQLQHHP
jgi:hypothetical protein